MVIIALQSQIDSLTSTVALLMDKFDSVEHRTLLAEQRVNSLLDNNPHNHSSTFEAKKRSASVLRHISNKSNLTNDEVRSEVNFNFEAVCDRVDEL